MNPDQERRLKVLEDWKRAKEIQQITLPLDSKSFAILNDLFVSAVDNYTVDWAYSGMSGQFGVVELVQGPMRVVIRTQMIRYRVNPVEDTITVIDTINANKLENGTQILFYSSENDPPGGIVAGGGGNTYTIYDITPDGFTFKIMDALSAPVNITSFGTGKQLIYVVA